MFISDNEKQRIKDGICRLNNQFYSSDCDRRRLQFELDTTKDCLERRINSLLEQVEAIKEHLNIVVKSVPAQLIAVPRAEENK